MKAYRIGTQRTASALRWGVVGALALGAFGLSLEAQAISQPDGTEVPEGNALLNYLNAEGESINPVTDAATTPQTFTPQCALTFTVLARGGGQMNSFGWYNATGTKPEPHELYEFIACSDGVGTVKSLDVRSDPRWLGGDIGFFQATTEGKTDINCVNWSDLPNTLGHFFYSEDRYNPDNNPEETSNWVHLLIMNTTRPELQPAFYFGWEDLYSGGDNDFEDLLMRVEGIRCSGGGEICDTGQSGKCATGTTQCVNGSLECLANEQATAEVCNAIDDNCDGQVDEGDDLCEPGLVCDRGVCRPGCSGGEFKCETGSQCINNLCVESACVGVDCPSGSVCRGGECKAPCDGVACPHGQLCRQGVCMDPCDGVSCDSDYYCEPTVGVCVLKCSCRDCDTGFVCNTTSNTCVTSACESVTCDANAHCVDGTCVDNCEGAVCPKGEVCQAGACVPDENGQGGSGGGQSTGGSSFGGDSFGGDSFGGSSMGGNGGSGEPAGGNSQAGGATPFNPESGTSDSGSGCGCRVAGSEGLPGASFGWLALLGLGWLRRRRSSHAA